MGNTNQPNSFSGGLFNNGQTKKKSNFNRFRLNIEVDSNNKFDEIDVRIRTTQHQITNSTSHQHANNGNYNMNFSQNQNWGVNMHPHQHSGQQHAAGNLAQGGQLNNRARNLSVNNSPINATAGQFNLQLYQIFNRIRVIDEQTVAIVDKKHSYILDLQKLLNLESVLKNIKENLVQTNSKIQYLNFCKEYLELITEGDLDFLEKIIPDDKI